ncbi:MAG: hypothetical protein OEN56_10480 [Gemmatimonadota bacterium]|nr:hypothetical protein [Gemmatimonadota bacterium]
MNRKTGAPSRGSALALAMLASTLASCGAGGQTMNGTYTIVLPEGTATLSLAVLPSGTVSGWMRSVDGTLFEATGLEVVDDEGDVTVEGTLSGAMNADFSLYEEDDPEFGLLLTPHDASGNPVLAEAVVFAAVRSSLTSSPMTGNGPLAGGATRPSPPPEAGSPAAGPADARLVGLWSTQTVMNSEVGSVATQMFMELTSDGVMRDLGSRAIGSIGDGGIDTGLEGGGEQAVWHTQDDLLMVGYPGGPSVPLARFGFSEGRLVLRYLQDGSIQIWSRVR